MNDLFRNFDWVLFLRRSGLVASVGLMIVSFFGFNQGLGFNGGLLVSSCLWIGFTIIQFIGNYWENHEDWVFFLIWLLTYMVGIGAGTWAMYGWITIANEPIHWVCAFGLGGAAELVPERLLAMFVKSMKVTSAKPNFSQPKPNNGNNPRPNNPPQKPFTPSPYKNAPAASFGGQRPQRPLVPNYQNQPKYRNLNEEPEEPNF